MSLVRSNKEGRAGFLNTSNRVNVLLSRAEHGMVLCGNAKTFLSERTTPLCAPIIAGVICVPFDQLWWLLSTSPCHSYAVGVLAVGVLAV